MPVGDHGARRGWAGTVVGVNPAEASAIVLRPSLKVPAAEDRAQPPEAPRPGLPLQVPPPMAAVGGVKVGAGVDGEERRVTPLRMSVTLP